MGLARGNAPSDNQLRVWRLDQSPAPKSRALLRMTFGKATAGTCPRTGSREWCLPSVPGMR